jgi:hypothetical protein
MKNPLEEKPQIVVEQKNGNKKILTEILNATAQLIDDGERYDLKIVLKRKVK